MARAASQTGPGGADSSRAEPGWDEPSRAGLGRAERSRAKPRRAKPGRAEPEPSRAKSEESRADPFQNLDFLPRGADEQTGLDINGRPHIKTMLFQP